MFNFLKSNKGFSLLDICIFLMVAGLIIGGMLAFYKSYIDKKSISVTVTAMVRASAAINDYIVLHGRYPRPASLIAVQGDATFGAEGPTAPPLCNDPAWRTTTGMCLSPGGTVLVGTIPFAILGINPDTAIDFWHSRIVYAVTLSQTDTVTYAPTGAGAITVQALNQTVTPATVDTIADAVTMVPIGHDMILLSHGREGRGAYTRDGVLAAACDAALMEGINCDYTETFLLDSHPTIPQSGSRSYMAGPSYYDDFTLVQRAVSGDNWRRSQNPLSPNFLVTEVDRIGVGTNAMPTTRLEIVGDLRATGEIRADDFCRDTGGVDCFTPEMIAGSMPQMDCGTSAFVLGDRPPIVRIGSERVFCGSPVNGGTPVISAGGEGFVLPSPDYTSLACPTGEYMTGINASGVPQCAPP